MSEVEPFHGKNEDVFFWLYVPSLVGSIVSAGSFFVISSVHTWKTYKTRTWFTVPLMLGCYCMMLGFAGHAFCSNSTDSLACYLIESVFIVIAPTLYAATIYMLFTRLVRRLNAAKHSVTWATWLTRVFVGDDMFALNTLGIAASVVILPGQATLGKILMLLGMLFQVTFFGIFVVTIGIFHRRIARDGTVQARYAEYNWIGILQMLYFCSALILVRSVFRTVEIAQADTGYLLRHEWALYTFNILPMLFVAVVFVWYFARHIEENTLPAGSERVASMDGEAVVFVSRIRWRQTK